MFRTGVLNTLTGKVSWSVSPQICFLKRIAWVVRAVTFLAMVLKGVQMKSAAVGLPMWSLSMLVRCPIIYYFLFPMVECSYLESLLSMSQLHLDLGDQQRAVDAQWQFTQQTYGLHRPSRDGFLQIFRAVSSYIGPGNPAILSVPVSIQDSPDFVLNLIEQGWNDLRIPGTVVPWQLFPIDSTRAQSGHRALEYPSYVMVSHDDFASFEQRPHGLMEVVVPGGSWLFGTVLPWRVNWPIIREFITLWCPMGMVVDRIEIILSGVHLTEQLVECWHGFYARIILTYGGSPSPVLLPFRQLGAPLPHLRHTMVGNLVRKHIVYVPGGTSLLFSYTFEALGKEVQWFGGLPGVLQESALLLCPCAFRLLRVHEVIRGFSPLCPDSCLDSSAVPYGHCCQDLVPAHRAVGCHLLLWSYQPFWFASPAWPG